MEHKTGKAAPKKLLDQVRDAKGAHDRYTLLPASLVEPLHDHLIQVKRTHAEDLSKGYGAVYLPFALAEKYPNAIREWIWQYVFPSHSLSPDEQDGVSWMSKFVWQGLLLSGVFILTWTLSS